MADRLLSEGIVSQVQEAFAQLNHPVQVLFFGSKSDCDYCQDTLQLVEELVEISGKLHLQTFDIDEDAAVAKQYNVDKVPGLVIAGRDGDKILDYGVRLAGIPSGHEFSSLIQDMILVSNRDSGLDSDTREFLGGLTQPVLLQVFVTPT